MDRRIIAFAPEHNHKRKDAQVVFKPEGRRFLAHHDQRSLQLTLIDNSRSKWSQRRDVLRVLRTYKGSLEHACVAFFCHGYKSGLQLGFKLRHAKILGRRIAELGDKAPVVVLYACDTARDLDRDRRDDLTEFGGDRGFADRLRDSLCRYGAIDCQVDAHTTAGHATRNPNVRRFYGDGSSTGGAGGQYIVPHGHPLWSRWRESLKTPFRFDFPFLSIEKIHDMLEAGL